MADLLHRLARVIRAAAERYAALGDVRGTLRLPNLTEEERLALTGLLGEYVKTRPGQTLTLSLTKLDARLRERGLGDSLQEVAATLDGRPLETRAEQQAALAARWERLLAAAWPAQQGRALRWREGLRAGESSALALLQREFNQEERAGQRNHRRLTLALEAVTLALDHLPADQGRSLRLPVFANRFTGDPHGFDDDAFAGRLLQRALTDLIGPTCGLPTAPEDAVERGILLTAAGLLPDGISSYVATFGLAGAGGVLLVPLRQVANWTSLALSGPVLYAVENPPVFEELVDSLEQAGMERPLVCTSGFLSVAAYRLLDLAAASGATIAYGGDFDPNGLTITARLMQRYGDRLKLWRMGVDDYLTAANHARARSFTGADLRRLATHASTPLESLSRAMQDRRMAAYQEALLERLRQDLLGNQYRQTSPLLK
ncbi:MAG: TIGR02679 family protein [Bacillota bacterium]